MPSRLARFQQSGDFHFLTFSCHDTLPYLATAAARDLFERTLEHMRSRMLPTKPTLEDPSPKE
jgi:putative transposase